jgi:hypothetical protein
MVNYMVEDLKKKNPLMEMIAQLTGISLALIWNWIENFIRKRSSRISLLMMFLCETIQDSYNPRRMTLIIFAIFFLNLNSKCIKNQSTILKNNLKIHGSLRTKIIFLKICHGKSNSNINIINQSQRSEMSQMSLNQIKSRYLFNVVEFTNRALNLNFTVL